MQNRPLAQIELEAARWLNRRDSADWGPTDQAELDQWLQASISHRISFIRVGAIWRRVAELKCFGETPRQDRVPPPASPSPRTDADSLIRVASRRPLLKFLALAASIMLIVSLAVVISLRDGTEYTTTIGGFATVHLDDGSVIDLNTNTRLRVHFHSTARDIELTQGEALFEIAQDPHRPLTVYAAHRRILVLGTRFSVWSKPNGLRIEVISGQVRAEPIKAVGKNEPSPFPEILGPGTVLDVHDDGGIEVLRTSMSDIQESLAWLNGEISLKGVPLSEAIAEFNRYHVRQIVIADPSLLPLSIGGRFRWDNVEGFLRLLESMGIHSETKNNEVVLTRSS